MRTIYLRNLICSLLFFVFGFYNTAFAQNMNADYWDGQVFVKISDKAGLQLPTFEAGVSDIAQYPMLSRLIDKYKIQRIFRPFEKLNTPVFNLTYALHFAQVAQVEQLIRELQAMDWVEYAEKVPYERLCLMPNDPYITNNTQWHIAKVQAFSAWDLSVGSSNVVVAVVDDGVRLTHEDLAANIWINTDEIAGNGIDDDGNGYVDDVNGWDGANNDNNPNPPSGASNFYFSHGTHCAGIAAAVTNNAKGGGAISHNVKVMACKGANDSNASLSGIWQAFSYAMNNYPQVISCSWGGGGYSQTYQNVVNEARNRGIIVVAAAGNDNTNSVFYPAGYANVISVASSNQSDQKSSFSNYGSWIDITAPGSSIRSTVATSNTSYQYYDGTSMACPNVASLIALILSYNPSLSPTDVESCLYSGADNINSQNSSYVGLLGAGRINAFNSLQCANPAGCLIPNGLNNSALTATSTTLQWNTMPNALSYNIRYRVVGSSSWTTVNSVLVTSLPISGLNGCTQYEFQVQSNCNGEQSNFSAVRTFATPPSGLQTYCTAKGNSVSYEWIAQVVANTINNSSGANSAGYSDFRCTSTTLTQGNTYNISLTPGFAGQTYTEYWRIWIDFNQNGVFDDPSERVYSSSQASANTVNGTIAIPATALTGPTTMRVVMKWVASSDTSIPNACGNFAYGEVEDYGVNIISSGTPTPTCNIPAGLSAGSIGSNQATLNWGSVSGAISYNVRWLAAGSTTWQTTNVNSTNTVISSLIACTQYEFQVQSVCGNGLSSNYSGATTFSTIGCAAPCIAPAGLGVSGITTTSAAFSWAAVSGAQSYNLQYRYVGAPSWQTVNITSPSYITTNLTECLGYEWQVQTVCSATNQSTFAAGQNFTTNCSVCPQPDGIQATLITNTSAKIIWNAAPGATSYNVRLRAVGAANWITATILDLDADFTGAVACTQYEFQIRTVCSNNTTSAWTSSLLFTTDGCPDNSGYCASSGQNSSEEWIQTVQIANINNNSGNNGGYEDFTAINTEIVIDSIYNITLTPGFNPQPFTEYWRIWIDLNKDIDFDDAGELVFDAGTTNTGVVNGTLQIPAGTVPGTTRMRVSMKFVDGGTFATLPGQCMNFSYGEVEDYTLKMVEAPPPPPPPAPEMLVKLRILLEGCYNPATDAMSTQLRTSNLIPASQPFFRAPWYYEGEEAVINQGVIPANIVDWVLLEAYDPINFISPIARKAAFLRSNGQIVDVDGITEGVRFPELIENNTYVFFVRPRAHMAVMGAQPLLMPNTDWYDFSTAATQAFGNNQLKQLPNGLFALFAGDYDHNGVINYADANLYYDDENQIGQYLNTDANKDGRTQYNDYQLLKANTGILSISIVRY